MLLFGKNRNSQKQLKVLCKNKANNLVKDNGQNKLTLLCTFFLWQAVTLIAEMFCVLVSLEDEENEKFQKTD